MGDELDEMSDGLVPFDIYPMVTQRRQTFEEWLQDRREVYQQLRRPDIPAVLVDAVEAFRFDEGFIVRGSPDADFLDSTAVFDKDPSWDPDDNDLDQPDAEDRPAIVHDAINSDVILGVPITTMAEGLAVILYQHLSDVEVGERQKLAPARTKGQLSRRAISDVAYDMLTCLRAFHRPPGPALMLLLEKLLGVEDRRLKSPRQFKKRLAAIAADAEKRGLTTQQLADLIGSDSGTISRWRRQPEYMAAVEEHRQRLKADMGEPHNS